MNSVDDHKTYSFDATISKSIEVKAGNLKEARAAAGRIAERLGDVEAIDFVAVDSP